MKERDDCVIPLPLLLTRRKTAAPQLIRRRSNTTLPERLRQITSTRKQIPQQRYRIGDISLTVAVGVGGVKAGGTRTLGEEVTEGEDGVGDIEVAVGVGVATLKCQSSAGEAILRLSPEAFHIRYDCVPVALACSAASPGLPLAIWA